MTMKIVHFSSQEELRKWLVKNHAAASELFVGFHKKSSRKKGATYSEALDEALCFGWIDGVRRSIDADSYMIRFTPRRPKSIWSLVNVRHVERLQKAGKMAEPGLKAFALREKHRSGACCAEEIVFAATRVLKRMKSVTIEYVEAVDAETLAPDPSLDRPILIAIAARVGKTRLIDNTVLQP